MMCFEVAKLVIFFHCDDIFFNLVVFFVEEIIFNILQGAIV